MRYRSGWQSPAVSLTAARAIRFTGNGQTFRANIGPRGDGTVWLVIDLIKAVEAERAAAQAISGEQAAVLLVRFTGIGAVSAHVLADAISDRNFGNHRELASFFGLASSPSSSGSVQRDQGISRAGNPRARRVAVAMAWLRLRYQPDSGLSRWFRERVGTTRGRMRRIMIVALARKLMVALWRYLTTGALPEGAVMAAA